MYVYANVVYKWQNRAGNHVIGLKNPPDCRRNKASVSVCVHAYNVSIYITNTNSFCILITESKIAIFDMFKTGLVDLASTFHPIAISHALLISIHGIHYIHIHVSRTKHPFSGAVGFLILTSLIILRWTQFIIVRKSLPFLRRRQRDHAGQIKCFLRARVLNGAIESEANFSRQWHI